MKMLMNVISAILASGAAITAYEYYDRKKRMKKSYDVIATAIANDIIEDYDGDIPISVDDIVAKAMNSMFMDEVAPYDYGIVCEKVTAIMRPKVSVGKHDTVVPDKSERAD